MTGEVVQDADIWVWRTPGQNDLLLRHNEWGETTAAQDLPKLQAPLARVSELVATAREAVAKEFYTLWQDAWKQPGDEDLSRDEFKQALVLTNVSYPSGQYLHSHFDMAFEDGGLFFGHAFFVAFTMDGVLDGVDMFG